MSQSIDLRSVVLFSQLPEDALADVTACLKSRQLEAGEVIFNLGDPGDELIIVAEGSVAIYAPDENDPQKGQPIRVFQPGEMLGEMALIDQKNRSLSARAEEKSAILTLGGEDFHRLMKQNPEMPPSVMAGLSDRIRYTTDFLSEVRDWVQRITQGNYQTSGIIDSDKYEDETLATLAADFAKMAAQVKEREETLRKEVAQLRIEIDETKRKKEAERIMGSDYYKSLQEKVKTLRQQK